MEIKNKKINKHKYKNGIFMKMEVYNEYLVGS
jgi:hypothetical protein